MSVVLLFVLLMVVAVMIRLAYQWCRVNVISGGDESSDDDDDSSELDLIDPDEMPGHTGGADTSSSSLSQDHLRDMFDLYGAGKK